MTVYNPCMLLLSKPEVSFLEAVRTLAYSNPFLPEWVEAERAALGKEFTGEGTVWSLTVNDPQAPRANVWRIKAKLEPLLEKVRSRLKTQTVADAEARLYEESVHYLLFLRYYPQFVPGGRRAGFYRQFLEDWHRFLSLSGPRLETADSGAHFFACFRQLQRAIHHIFAIVGSSMPAARLRASVWQSIFTHDPRRYRRTLYRRMGDFPTLITGPSGTGKELVGRAIAGSRYVSFDERKMEFDDPADEPFFPVNLAALSPALIESELFGHRRGAFTGAVDHRKGWLEACPVMGAVFLDELGELDLSLQVKLLRVIETRRFSAVGETAVREFRGKLIAATNRDLALEIRTGRFRSDLYYRLCADMIRTPSLAEQIRGSPEALREVLLFMVRRAVGEEAETALQEVENWVVQHLPRDYSWPGNYREVEQCVRNLLIRNSYQPVEDTGSAREDPFFSAYRAGRLKANEVLAHYAALVYRHTGSYEEAARRMGLDRRTVKTRVEEYLANTVAGP